MLPPPAQSSGMEPIKGLKIQTPGFRCNVPPCCSSPYPYIAILWKTLVAHWASDGKHTVHPTSIVLGKRYALVPEVQTILAEPPYNRVYFAVSSRGPPAPLPAVEENPKGDELLDILRLEAQNVLGDASLLTGHSVLIHPAFRDMQMFHFWETLDMADVKKILAIKPVTRKNASRKTLNLIKATIASFMASTESAKRAHESILQLITSGGR